MSIVFLIIGLIILAGLIWLATQPAAYEVTRSRVIQVSPSEVYSKVADLRHWGSWSPWLMHESDSAMEYGDTTNVPQGWFSWSSNHIGSGKVTHVSMVENESIEQALEFHKPVKSKTDVSWRFSPVGDATEVTWSMRGKMPFLFRWMSRMMDGWVGKDYEIGLAKLAMVSGDDSDPFEISFPGVIEGKPVNYLFSHFAGSVEDMKTVMSETYPKLMQAVVDSNLEINGVPFTLYHEFNQKKNQVICDMAIPVAEVKEVDGFSVGFLPEETYQRTALSGDYKHLKMAWYSAFSHARMFKYKIKTGKPMIERYVTDIREHQGLAIKTTIDIPLKS